MLAQSYREQVEDQKAQVETLKGALVKLGQKLDEAKSKRDLLIARHRRGIALGKAAHAQTAMGDNSKSAAFDRLKDRVQHTAAGATAEVDLLSVAAEVRPKTLQSQDHVQLPVREMFEKAVADKAGYVLPVVVTLVRDFFLQHGTDGNHCSKRISEDQELQEKLPAEHAQARRQNNRCDSHDLDDGRKQLKQPQIRKSKRSDPAVTWAEEHVAIRPQHV